MLTDLLYTPLEIAKITNGFVLQQNSTFNKINYLLIDSRKILYAETCVFFAIVTKRNDGHSYINDLYEKGVRNFIISKEDFNTSFYPEANFIKVENTLEALQTLTQKHREQFKTKIIAITGSNGKTIVKEWLFQLLCDDFKIVRNPKSFNSQIGVPLSVWQINQNHNLGIFEAGISMPSEMENLEKIIQPEIGIFTNIGLAHNEFFQSQNQKIQEKLKLFKNCKTIIYCKDYKEIDFEIQNFISNNKIKTFSWSFNENADFKIISRSNQSDSTEIKAIYKNTELIFQIPFTDKASIENAIHCICTMLLLDYSQNIIQLRLANLSHIAMRLEQKEAINHCVIINDSYNNDLHALSIAIDYLAQHNIHQKKTIILSDILQTGLDDYNVYKQVAEMLMQKNINRIIGIGNNISKHKALFKIEHEFYNTTNDFIDNFHVRNFKDEVILLKGARIFEFELISHLLQQRTHETVMEINLSALIHNLNYYRGKLKPNTKVMAMVKAFSYGSGGYEIANVLEYHKIDYLAVAYSDEGVELRKSGIKVPIMVMNPEMDSFDHICKYNLEPEIYSFRVLDFLLQYINQNRFEIELPIKIHIKIDTGMHRLGFEHQDITKLCEVLCNNSNILKVESIFSHMVGSDDETHDDFSYGQIELFRNLSNEIEHLIEYKTIKHILNSAGISRFTEFQMDMVRLGIGLYGIGCNNVEQKQLENVSTLKTTISQVKKVKANNTIGYSRKWTAQNDMTIATIPIGYADGLDRQLSNGNGKVLINKTLCPIIGNICMDMCMIDISHIVAHEGDEVIVFGKENPIWNIANDLKTISYEVLTSISKRVKRIYYYE